MGGPRLLKAFLPKFSFRLPEFATRLFIKSYSLNVFSFFKFRPKYRSEELLAFVLEDQEIKLALVTSNLPGKKEAVQIRLLNIRDLPEDEVAKKLQAALDEMKVQNPRVIGVVPSHWAITRNIEIPSRDETEIREIVNLQASRNTPYSRSEIVVDYLNLGVFKTVYSRILLVIAPRAAFNRYAGILGKLNLRPERMIFSPEAIVRNTAQKLPLESEKSPYGLIRVDTNTSDFAVASRGLLLYIRSIPLGAQQLIEEKQAQFVRFIEEVKRSLEAYQGENIGELPATLFLTGAEGEQEGLASTISDVLRVKVVRVDEWEGMGLRPDAKTNLPSATHSFLDVVSPLLFPAELSLDLTPEENKLRRSVEERSREIIKTGVLSMVLLGLFGFTFLSHLLFRKAQIAELEHRFQPLKKEARELEQAYTQVQAVRSYLAARGKSIETLAELYDLVPLDMFLTDIKYDETSKLTVKGSALSRSSIFGFAGGLEGSLFFRNIQTKYVTERKEEGKKFSDFEISASFEP